MMTNENCPCKKKNVNVMEDATNAENTMPSQSIRDLVKREKETGVSKTAPSSSSSHLPPRSFFIVF